jgi:hypothetical protein
MTKIAETPVLSGVPSNGHVLVSNPAAGSPGKFTFARVPGSAIGGGDLSNALLNDRAADGSSGGIGEAPNDASTYGRHALGWTQVLPLTGGTLTSHLTGPATAANLNVVTTATGSGVNGPLTAHAGINISLHKDNWYSGPSGVGEIDGLLIECRQSGAASDCSGILVNLQNTGTGYMSVFESVTHVVDPIAGVLTKGIGVQLGTMDPGASNDSYGTVISANIGANTVAHQVQNQPGASWTYAYRVQNDNTVTYTVDPFGDVYMAGGLQVANIHVGQFTCDGVVRASQVLTDDRYLYGFLNNSTVYSLYNAATNAIEFHVGNPTFTIAGSGTVSIFNQQVLQPRISGWGTATNGSRNPFDAATATLPQVAAALAQLITDLRTHGLIGT